MHRERFTLYLRHVPMSGIDWLVDAVIALGAFGFGLLQMSLFASLMVPDDLIRRLLGLRAITLSAWGVAAVALTCAPLIVRRRLPWPVLVVTMLFWGIFDSQMGTASLPLIGPLVALFTVAYERPRAEALVAGIAVLVVMGACTLNAPSDSLGAIMLVQNAAITVAVAFGGYALRARTEVMEAAQERADAAERTRESEAQQRVQEERLRIARELHDITAHSLTAVSVQAAAASALVDSDPAAAKEALSSIRGTSRGALDELRGVIGVLREGETASAAETQPVMGLEQLSQIAAYLEQAGVACELDEQMEPDVRVPAYVGTALFSIAREAATNIVRHADAHHARISLAVSAGRAEVSVADDGRGLGSADSAHGGHGVEGMRERAQVLGGAFSMGEDREGGVRVTASIPFGGEEA